MSLGLHINCRQRLIEKIAELLPQVKVQNRMFLEQESTMILRLVEPILPQNRQLTERLEQYISETPIFDFVREKLSQELLENQQYDSESSVLPLNEIAGYNEPNVTANRIIQHFESLPWEYTLSIKIENDFGELFGKTIRNYVISNLIKIVSPGEDFSEEFPLTSGVEGRDRYLLDGTLLTGVRPQQWDLLSTYFQVRVIGFIGRYGITAPIIEAISLLKAFCGIGIALRLFKVNFNYRPIPTKAKFFIHRQDADEWVIERMYDLEAGLSDTLHDLVLHDLDGNLESEAAKVSWINGRIGEISCVFTHKEKAKKIIRASQWLFDSYCGKNELLSFIQTTVVMEILLGEKTISDLMGLGELLRNRCAYLIGDSHKQREDILKDFKEIYDVRSRIVHRGKAKLNMNERYLFFKLQWMCRRVIQKEVELLQKDIRNNK
jgi:hypothetical protein